MVPFGDFWSKKKRARKLEKSAILVHLSMDLGVLRDICKKAIAEDKYVLIRYNGTYRNIYPISFRKGPGGYRLYAWCEIHPQEESESFLLNQMDYAVVSEDTAYIKPQFVGEI